MVSSHQQPLLLSKMVFLDMIPDVTQKVKNIISKKGVTEEEMAQISDIAENLDDVEF